MFSSPSLFHVALGEGVEIRDMMHCPGRKSLGLVDLHVLTLNVTDFFLVIVKLQMNLSAEGVENLLNLTSTQNGRKDPG